MSKKIDKIFKPRITSITKVESEVDITPNVDSDSNSNTSVALKPNVTRPWFYANELASIYNFPAPTFTNNLNVAVISFGGGLYGTYDPVTGILTNSDCHQYWQSIGIAPANMPTIIVKTINGASNLPNINDGGSTYENTIDVQQIGACCPTSKLTIVLYIGPNTLSQFVNSMNYILTTSPYTPSVISISWGLAEIYYTNSLLTSINTLFATAVSRGINICTATGDNGSNDGVGGTGSYADFPSSSPNVIACGGTKLICPDLVYNGNTTETAWSSGGGAVSAFFAKPTYQNAITAAKRSVPDIAMNADPSTGVNYLINGGNYIIGGTSIVAPTMAGFLMAINTTLFGNNVFYNNLNCFHDVVSGNNGAFNASTGYDNCTGLGSIIGGLLSTAFGTSVPPPPPPPPPAPVVKATSVRISPRALSLKFPNTYQLGVTVSPTTTTNKAVTWTSSNTRIFRVSATGLITPVNYGSANVTVRTADGSNKTDTIRVTITR